MQANTLNHLLLTALLSFLSAAAQAQHVVPKERMFAMTSRPTAGIPSGVIEVTRDKVSGDREQEPISVRIDGIETALIRPTETARFYVAAGNRVIEISAPNTANEAVSNEQLNRTNVQVSSNAIVKFHIIFSANRNIVKLTTPAHSNIRFDKIYAYDSEDGAWVDISPPSENSLQPAQISGVLSFNRPANWPLRAINISTQGVFEFDRQGNVLMAASTTVTNSVLGQLLQNGHPVWPKATIYYPISDQSKPVSAELLDSPRGLILQTEKQVCPVALIATGYRMLKEISTPILNGDCSRAVKRTIGKETFWVYPASAREQEPELYWSVQYFDEPVRPMRDALGQCVLYCDAESRRAAELRSKAP